MRQNNILLIRLKSIGDVVLTLPAVHAVRENFPSARITFLTSQENAVLLRGFAEVDEVIALDRATLRGANPLKVVPEFFSLIRQLRAGKFSLAVDFQGYGETAWLARITGAPQRWGQVSRPGCGWAYTQPIQPITAVHPAEAHLELLKQCGLEIGAVRNEFSLSAGVVDEVRAWFVAQGLALTKPTIYLHPFTSGAHKNWPLEKYLAVARHWLKNGVQIILGGGPADQAALEPARREGFAVSAGVPLLITGGIMQLSTLKFGGDTGVLHLAVALDKRVLMLLHQANAGSPSPFQHSDWVVVAPRPEAIAEITVVEVNAAIARIFQATSR